MVLTQPMKTGTYAVIVHPFKIPKSSVECRIASISVQCLCLKLLTRVETSCGLVEARFLFDLDCRRLL